MVNKCPLQQQKELHPIREVQTDNGSEFTNRLLVIKGKYLTIFEEALVELGELVCLIC